MRSGYLVKVQWEYEFYESGIVKQKPEMLTNPMVQQIPLRTRDALYGGRTEAMCLYHKQRKLKPFNMLTSRVSIHTYTNTLSFSIGLTVIHVDVACRSIEECLCMEGLIRCSIVPPDRLYPPVLTYMCNNKIMFCRCRTCVHTHQCGMYAYRG